uniref:Zinc finger protein 335 n=1 Tax=Cacopsylla melanoneura TaxID=428564 RepID=A0A8D9AMA7_9HEMI
MVFHGSEFFPSLPDDCVCQHCHQILSKELNALTTHTGQCKDTPRPDTSHAYVCYKCSYHTQSLDRITDHIKKHIRDNHNRDNDNRDNDIKKHVRDKNYGCPYCPYTARIRSQVKNHMITKHSNVSRMKCEFCNFSTKLIPQLRFHMNHKHANIL